MSIWVRARLFRENPPIYFWLPTNITYNTKSAKKKMLGIKPETGAQAK